METVTTLMADYAPPKGPGVRLRGMCLCLSPTTVQNYHYKDYTRHVFSEELKRFHSGGSVFIEYQITALA